MNANVLKELWTWLTGPSAMAADSLRWMSEGPSCNDDDDEDEDEGGELGSNALPPRVRVSKSRKKEGVKTQNLGQNLGFASDSGLGRTMGCGVQPENYYMSETHVMSQMGEVKENIYFKNEYMMNLCF